MRPSGHPQPQPLWDSEYFFPGAQKTETMAALSWASDIVEFTFSLLLRHPPQPPRAFQNGGEGTRKYLPLSPAPRGGVGHSLDWGGGGGLFRGRAGSVGRARQSHGRCFWKQRHRGQVPFYFDLFTYLLEFISDAMVFHEREVEHFLQDGAGASGVQGCTPPAELSPWELRSSLFFSLTQCRGHRGPRTCTTALSGHLL